MAAFETLFADGAGLASVSPPSSAAPSAGWLTTVLAVPALAQAGHCDLAELALAGQDATYLVPAECVPDEARPLSVDENGAISGSVPHRLVPGG